MPKSGMKEGLRACLPEPVVVNPLLRIFCYMEGPGCCVWIAVAKGSFLVWYMTKMSDGQKGVLSTVLWKVVPSSCVALFMIWLVVGVVGVWVLKQRDAEGLRASATQQTWAVAGKVDYFYDSLRSVAENAMTINAFIDPNSVEHFLQPFFRSFRIGEYKSLSIAMTDFTGMVLASNQPDGEGDALPPEDLWLTPAIDGEEVLQIKDGSLIAAVPVRIGALPEGVILVTLAPEDTLSLLSSKEYAGTTTLRHEDFGVIFNGQTGEHPSLDDFVESTAIPLLNFPSLTLTSAVAPNEETPLLSALHGFLLIAFLADLFALVFGIFVATNMVAKPLNHLVARIQSMQKLTDPIHRLPIEGPSELRNLASAFNEAVDRQAGLTVVLEEALSNEKQINETQRQFVSMVSHEFRTPLAIIDGQAQRVMRRIDKEPREGVLKSMEKCRSGVERLIRLIESMLSSSRLEAGAIEFNLGTCKLAELLEEAAKGQEGISPTHQIVLSIEQMPETIVADEKLMRQVFTNLLSNAVKYSPGASKVWVDARQEGPDVVIAFRDEGVGIPEKEIGKLFGRFFRASTSSGIAGTGIGLNLVKQLVEMHKGDISVSSVANEGTTFTIRLPIDLPLDTSAEAA